MGKKATSIIETYINFLNKIGKWLSDIESRKKWILNHQILTFFMCLIVILTCCGVGMWQRGQCINCEPLTLSQLQEASKDLEKFAQSVDNKIFIPYDSWNSYWKEALPYMGMVTLGIILGGSLAYIVSFFIYLLLAKVIFKKYNT